MPNSLRSSDNLKVGMECLLYTTSVVIRVLGIVISVHTQNNGNITIWGKEKNSIPDVLVLTIRYLCVSERRKYIFLIL